YRAVTGADVGGAARLTIERDGTAHGLAAWFDATLLDGVTFSNAPDQPELVYGSAFFPWPEPVTVRAGDEICVRFDARHVGEEYLWRWDSEVRAVDSSSQPRARFQQSTFYGAPLMPARLAKGAAAHTVLLDEDGQVERFILQ